MTRLRRHPDARATLLDGEAFLVRPDRDAILRLNPTAAAIWHGLAEPSTRDELVALFATAFPEVPTERLAPDLDRALAALRDAGMVVADDRA